MNMRVVFCVLGISLTHCGEAFTTAPQSTTDKSAAGDIGVTHNSLPVSGEQWCLYQSQEPTECARHTIAWRDAFNGLVDEKDTITISANKCAWMQDGKKYNGYVTSDRGYMHGNISMANDTQIGTFRFLHLLWEDPPTR